MIRLAVRGTADVGERITGNIEVINSAMGLIAFASIFFLWFMGVIRDRIGHREDQFFSTVFLGSGLIYLSLNLSSAGIAVGLIAGFREASDAGETVAAFVHMRHLVSVMADLATRFAGTFMISLAMITLQIIVFRRWFVLLTLGLAAAMLFLGEVTEWFVLIMPTWVLIVSLAILIPIIRSKALTLIQQLR